MAPQRATFLKDLDVSEVSSVDKGAGRGTRVMLLKRDSTFQEQRNAVAALSLCAESIFADDDVVDKSAASQESVEQFRNYVAGLKPDQESEMAGVSKVEKALGMSDSQILTFAAIDSLNKRELSEVIEKLAQRELHTWPNVCASILRLHWSGPRRERSHYQGASSRHRASQNLSRYSDA
jgi:hypothetical protein